MKEISDLEDYVSTERISTYLKHAHNDKKKAFALYCWNIEISAEFFKVISSFEIYIRNAVLKSIEMAFTDGIYNTALLGSLKRKDLNDFISILRKFDRRIVFNYSSHIDQNNPIPSNITIPKGKVVAKQDFYFWEMLLKNNFVNTAIHSNNREAIKSGFPNIPENVEICEIIRVLTETRGVRNRICHNEHLLNIDLAKLLVKMGNIMKYIDNEIFIFESEKQSVYRLINIKPI